jgi:MinD-like ATPase involved in chromosome partitioning or flagellar assembly
VRVELASGRRVTVTPHHPFLLADGWRPAHDIAVGEAVAIAARTPFPRRPVRVCGTSLAALAREVAAGPATMPAAVYRLPADQLAWVLALLWGPGESGGVVATEALARAVQHLLTRFAVATRITPDADGAWRVTVGGVAPEDTAWDEVVAIVPAGEQRVWDLCVEPTRCFVADDVVVHNTTTALLAAGTLARALRPAGKRVALVDANTAQSSIGTVLQRPARGSVLDLVRSDVDEGVLAAALTSVGGLDVLLGAPDLRTADRRLITTGLYRRIVATLRRTHDYVIVDTPVAEAVDHELFEDFVLRDSDSLVVVLDPHRETIHNNVEWLDIIGDPVSAGGRNVVPERIGVVLNRADPAQGWNGRTVGDQFRRYRYLGAIPDSPSIARAANEARLLDRFDPKVDHAVRTVLAALVAEPLVAPDPDPPPVTPLARLRAVGTRLRPGRNAQVHG